VITYSAKGRRAGEWTNCAAMTGDVFFGTNTACFSGKVNPVHGKYSLDDGTATGELFLPLITNH
jgi:hypothetical protein